MACNTTTGSCFSLLATVDSVTQSFAAASATVATSAIVAVSSAAAVSSFASGGGGGSSQGFITLRITKIATLIRYININFPYQVERLFKAFSKSENFISNMLIMVFGSEQYDQTKADLPARFIKFGDSSLFLKNAGMTLLVGFGVGIAIVLIRSFLYLAGRKRNKVWIKRLQSIQLILEWNYILGWIMGTYSDLILGFGLQMYHMATSSLNGLSIFSLIVCVIIVPFSILLPVICYILMQTEKKDRRSKYHNITRYAVLISDFKENNDNSKTYQIMGLLRIQAIVFPLVLWQSNPLAQILFMIISSLAVNIFQLLKVSYKKKFTNFVLLTNELLLFVSMLGIFFHITFINAGIESNNPTVSDIIGWVIASGILGLMGFNAFVSVLGVLIAVWAAIKNRSKKPTISKAQVRLSNRRVRRFVSPPEKSSSSILQPSRKLPHKRIEKAKFS